MAPSKPGIDGKWATDEHEHGYGGRLLLDEDGVLVPWDGTYWFNHKRVYDLGSHGNQPWKTANFARRVKNPYKLYWRGDRLPNGNVAANNVRSKHITPEATPGNPDPAPYRTSDQNGMGYLVEGHNIMGNSIRITRRGPHRWSADQFHAGIFAPKPHHMVGARGSLLPQEQALGDGLKGWPSHDQFEFYLRAGYILPLELRWQNGQPVIEVLDP